MMKIGEQIGNLKTGETLTMLDSAEGRLDSFQRYQVVLPPHRPSPPLHYHLAFAETFTVVAGTLTMYLGRERQESTLTVGRSLTAEVRVCHTFSNDREQPCTMIVTTRPAGGVVNAFRLAYGIANEGGSAADGLPKNPLVRLRFIQISQGFIPQLPLIIQKFLLVMAEKIARWSGLERRIQSYLG
jgi:mannose-6-phosphate isomerase-like protein (cupin superfamily)